MIKLTLIPIALTLIGTATVLLGAAQEPPATTQPATTQPEVDEVPEPLDPKTDKPGLEVGNEAPNATLLDVDGSEVRLEDLYADGPVIITFYRGKW